MTDYVHLVGAEDVSRAGHNMQAAAETMQRAISSIDYPLLQLNQQLEQFAASIADSASRIEAAVQKLAELQHEHR